MNKYLIGQEKDFHDFVNLISKEDKIGIITHTDLDGIASGVFLKKILESRDLNIEFIEFVQYGADVLKPFLEKNFDVLFFTDWNVDNFPDDLENLRKKGKVFVIDHHPLNENLKDKLNMIKTDSKYCSSHTIFDLASNGKYFNTKEWEWLVCSAIIADYCWPNEDVFNFIKSVYSEVKMDATIFNSEPGNIGKKIDNALVYYKPNFRKVFELVLKKDINGLEKADEIITKEIDKWIEKFKKEAEHFPEKKLYFYYATPKYEISRIVASIISDTIFNNSSVIFLSDMKDKENHIRINARNHTGEIDLGKLLKKCTEGFEDSTSGGHAKASGGDFPKKYVEEFKENLLNNL
jgi:single-stranded DNA-specific DHH superfamily exonuclease